jgi:hypothetical protein
MYRGMDVNKIFNLFNGDEPESLREKAQQVDITLDYKKIHLGYFDNIIDAKKARQDKSKELFGEFLNKCEK